MMMHENWEFSREYKLQRARALGSRAEQASRVRARFLNYRESEGTLMAYVLLTRATEAYFDNVVDHQPEQNFTSYLENELDLRGSK